MNKKISILILAGTITLSMCTPIHAAGLDNSNSQEATEINLLSNTNSSNAIKLEFGEKISGELIAFNANSKYYKLELPKNATVFFDINLYSTLNLWEDFNIYDSAMNIVEKNSFKTGVNKKSFDLKKGLYYIEVGGYAASKRSYDINVSRNYFNDTKNHWASNQINDFVDLGYVGGYEGDVFRPDNPITRAEFVTILNKTFGLSKISGKVFNDTNNHWSRKEVDIAVTNGVCNGKSATEFKPDDLITREEAAVMVSNYKKLSDNNNDKINLYYDSNKVSSWAKDSVEGVIEHGYMKGYDDNTFRPKNNITRAEAVSTLGRVK